MQGILIARKRNFDRGRDARKALTVVESSGPASLLLALPPAEAAAIEAGGQTVALDAGAILYAVGDVIDQIYFPLTCVASVTTELEDGRLVESATIGREGVVGLSYLLGAPISRQRVINQVPGQAIRISTRRIAAVLAQTPVLAASFGRYADAVMTTMSQSAACLAMHPVAERCARWLLTTSDRTGADRFHLTHEFLAAMLGVHRPTVTIAAGMLQRAGFLEYHRGNVHILDRPGLLAASCECYNATRAAQDDFLLAVSTSGE